MKSEKKIPYLINLKESLMDKARKKAKKDDTIFSQWIRNAIKKAL